MRRRFTSARGFSLIELLIVVTIILILAAIAIPRLIAVKMVANEAACVSNLRAIDDAEAAYAANYPGIGFSASLTALGGAGPAPSSAGALLLDRSLAQGSPIKSGYVFTYTPDGASPATTYAVNADPQIANVTGVRHFIVDETGIIHYKVGAPATSSDPALGS